MCEQMAALASHESSLQCCLSSSHRILLSPGCGWPDLHQGLKNPISTMLFIFQSQDFVKPWVWLARPPPGAQESQDPLCVLSVLLFILVVTISAFTGRHVVRAVSRQVRRKVRGLLCFLVSEA